MTQAAVSPTSTLPSRPRQRFTLPLYVLGGLSVTLMIVMLVAIFAWYGYLGSQQLLLSASDESIRHIREAISEKVQRVLAPARNQLTLLSHSALSSADNLARRLDEVPLVFDALEGDVFRVMEFPGNTICEGTFELPAGDYVVFSNLPAGDGTDFSRGMVATFTVE